MQKNGELADLLIIAGQLVSSVKEAALASHNITLSQYRLISALAGMSGVTTTVLARHTKLDNGTLSRLVNRLERIGMVERRPDYKDRRRICLYVTDKGNAMLPAMNNSAIHVDSILNNIDVGADVEHIARFLRVVVERARVVKTESDYESRNYATMRVAP